MNNAGVILNKQHYVAPARERGLKSLNSICIGLHLRRSREGAWIEMLEIRPSARAASVAPARERGLKYKAKAFFG